MVDFEEEILEVLPGTYSTSVRTETSLAKTMTLPVISAKSYNLVIGLDYAEVKSIVEAYAKDPYFSKVRSELQQESNWNNPKQPLFFENDDGLLYFEDWNGNNRLCIPQGE